MRLAPESSLHPKLREVKRRREIFRSRGNDEEDNIKNAKSK
jgi:hypothetical protein